MSPAPPAAPDPTLRACYRLQLRQGVTLERARTLVPYLDALGVSHLYLSPCFRAAADSAHGYDVLDPREVDSVLGDEADLEALSRALRERGMGLVLDWVPNHLGVTGGRNPWWDEMLAFGPDAPGAAFFDRDPFAAPEGASRRLLLPFLGEPYGEALDSGALRLDLDPATGRLEAVYYEHRFPLTPTTWAAALDADGEPDADPEMAAALAPLRALARDPAPSPEAATAARRELAAALASDSALAGRLAARLPADPDRLHALLERQPWRPAFWRAADHDLGHRRFFDVSELAGLRVEDPAVFETVHEALFRWTARGWVQGVRVDHVDGLRDPRGYLETLRRRLPEGAPLWVEKILEADESLPADWPVDGTTGYELLPRLADVFVDPAGEAPLEALHRELGGRPFAELLRASKRTVLERVLGSELHALARRLAHLAARDLRQRDRPAVEMERILLEWIAAVPVYRTYLSERGGSRTDRDVIEEATAAALRHRPAHEEPVLAWLRDLLLAVCEGGAAAESVELALRLQQLTGPAMAKGLEDTAFYRHHRLVSLNEVGGTPDRFGGDPERFHADALARAERAPRALLTTATHDTKRGEDVRARLHVLAQRARPWAACVRRWRRMLAPLRREVRGGPAPAPGHELLLLQTLVGSWPPDLVPEPGPDLDAYCERVQGFLLKAVREGKERSRWRDPDPDYEQAVTDFVAGALDPRRSAPFLRELLARVEELAAAGALVSLGQLVCKATLPGVPDFYQGTETWQLALTDPDNRRPVDFDALARRLEALRAKPPDPGLLAELLSDWKDGGAKLFATWRLLRERRRRPGLFAEGRYHRLEVRGAHAERVLAFARARHHELLVVAVPRLAEAVPRRGPFPLGAGSWGDTRVLLPPDLPAGPLRHVFSDAVVRPERGGLAAADLFAHWPVAAAAAPEVEAA